MTSFDQARLVNLGEIKLGFCSHGVWNGVRVITRVWNGDGGLKCVWNEIKDPKPLPKHLYQFYGSVPHGGMRPRVLSIWQK